MICDPMQYISFIFVVLHLFPFPESRFCLGMDSITLNRKIRDGETIVSAGEIFELGFFSPSTSNNLRYVGIWLKKFPNKKVVWVANRENPVRDSSGALLIGIDGNLVISDGANNIIWSTNVTLATNHTIAVLSDAGNLVLKVNNSDSSVLWASFRHPTDSVLPGMKIGLNTKTGEKITLTSWKDDRDPSIGNFSFVVDPQELPQGFIMNTSVKHWRTGQWARSYFIGILDMDKDQLTGFDLELDLEEGSIYIKYASSGKEILPIYYLTHTGEFLLMAGSDKEDNLYVTEIVAPIGPCDLYNTCGSFGSCNNTKSPICKCLQGYEPAKNEDEWSKGNWTSGCIRKSEFRCEKNTSSNNEKADDFFSMTRMKLPDSSLYVSAGDLSMCKFICLRNCSCLACAYVDGIGCMLWIEYLVDLQEFHFVELQGNVGEQLHIRLAYSELGLTNLGPSPGPAQGPASILAPGPATETAPILASDASSSTKTKITILTACSVTLVLVLGFVTYILYRWRNTKRAGRRDTITTNEGVLNLRDYQQRYLLRNEITQAGNSEVPSFSLQIIEAATDNFSSTNKLGEGGFGPVYKGKLPDGQEIAVKRLSRSSGQGTEEFKNEVILISRLQHRSLVKLLGFCIQGEETLLVYEYMPNKSLDKLIFGSGSTENDLPDWNLRFKIIEGIARGLIYLHRDSRLKIIHRDLKTSNILLDEHMNPKISDFGMARIFGGDQSTANTNRVVGTYGYMSPEYAMQGIFSEKSDVFSFGVLLLEVVSGKRNNTFYHYDKPQTLLAYAWQLLNEGKAIELLDHRLDNSSNPTQVTRCIHVALLCVQEHANDRPTMSVVLSMLCNEMDLTSPDRPAFSSTERLDASNISMPSSSSDSRNDCSITSVDGR